MCRGGVVCKILPGTGSLFLIESPLTQMCDIIGVSPSIGKSLLKQPLTDSGIKQEEEVEEEEERLLRSELYLIEGTR